MQQMYRYSIKSHNNISILSVSNIKRVLQNDPDGNFLNCLFNRLQAYKSFHSRTVIDRISSRRTRTRMHPTEH